MAKSRDNAIAKKNTLKFELDPELFYQKAGDYLEDGNLWLALKSIRKAIRIEPGCVEYSILLMEILAEMGLHDVAVDVGMRALSYDETMVDFYFHIASVLVAMNETQASLSYVNAGIKMSRELSDIGLGLVREELNTILKRAKTEKCFTLVKKDDDIKLTIEWAKGIYLRGEFETALMVLEQLPEDIEEPYWTQAMVLRSNCYAEMELIAESKKAAKLILKKHPHEVNAHTNLLIAALKAKDTKKAESILSTLRALTLLDKESRFRLCCTLLRFGLHKEGLDECERLIDVYPYLIDAMLLQGIAYYNLGNTYRAKEIMLDILVIDETNTIARYYNTLFQKNEKRKKSLPYSLVLPEKEIISRIVHLNKAAELNDDGFEEWLSNYDNICRINWLAGNAADSQAYVDTLYKLFYTSNIIVEDIFRENLASLYTSAISKRELLYLLLTKIDCMPVVLTVGYDMRILNTKLPKSFKDRSPPQKHVFFHAFASLALVMGGFEKALLKTFNALIPRLDPIEEHEENLNSVSAAIACLMDKKLLMKNKDSIIEVFSADSGLVDYYIDLFDK